MQDLFTPLTVGSLTVRNRFAMAPMTRAASPDGIRGPDVAAYYARRAVGDTGQVITEGIRIPYPGPGWRAVTAAVRVAVGPDFPITFRFSQWKMNHHDARTGLPVIAVRIGEPGNRIKPR